MKKQRNVGRKLEVKISGRGGPKSGPPHEVVSPGSAAPTASEKHLEAGKHAGAKQKAKKGKEKMEAGGKEERGKGLHQMTVPELRKECERRRLKVTEGGKYVKKAGLIVRIVNADRGQATMMKAGDFCGSGEVKPGGEGEVEGPSSAAPEPPDGEIAGKGRTTIGGGWET